MLTPWKNSVLNKIIVEIGAGHLPTLIYPFQDIVQVDL